jgi:dipeptidyl aminopeptidase/acylaminoacyl peptidase
MARATVAFGALVGVAAAVVVVGYGIAGALVYLRGTRVKPDCGGRFAGFTPAAFSATWGDPGNPEIPYGAWDAGPYLMPHYETVSIPSRDPRITIDAWYVPPAEPSNGRAVLMIHGYGSCKRDPVVLLPSGMLHRNGFAVLLADLRDNGASTIEDGRSSGGTDDYLDVLGAWDWLIEEKRFDPGRIGIFGGSLGANSVMIALGEEPRIAAAWEDSGWSSAETAIREELAFRGYPTWLAPAAVIMARLIGGVDMRSRSPEKALRRLAGRPLFIVHGDPDERVLTHHAFDLAAAARAGGVAVEPWIIPSPGHTIGMFLLPDEYERRLVEFFSLEPQPVITVADQG